MNARLRKVTRNRGQFTSGQAALEVLYLAVRNLEEFRGCNVGIRSSGCHHQRVMVLRSPEAVPRGSVTGCGGGPGRLGG